MNTNFTKVSSLKFSRITTLLAVGIAVSIGVPALAGVLWVNYEKKKTNNYIPINAVVGGSQKGSKLYVCQAIHDKEYTPGKLTEAYNCYIPWGNKEHRYTKYRVLTGNNWRWRNTGGKLPSSKDRVWGGNEDNGGNTLYVCRAKLNNEYIPGKYYNPTKTCYVSYGKLEYRFTKKFEFLTAN
jgi:hypothetical protein